MPPWELAEQPTYWRDLALIAESAEASAQEMAIAEERRKARIEKFANRN